LKNFQNTDFSLNTESSLGRTKMFLGRRLDAPDLHNISALTDKKPEIHRNLLKNSTKKVEAALTKKKDSVNMILKQHSFE
jgi:hypothetical protein